MSFVAHSPKTVDFDFARLGHFLGPGPPTSNPRPTATLIGYSKQKSNIKIECFYYLEGLDRTKKEPLIFLKIPSEHRQVISIKFLKSLGVLVT